MIFNELPTAFPWYDKKEKQNRYRENAEKLTSWGLITPRDALLPFQFWRGTTSAVTGWTIKNADTDSNAAVLDAASVAKIRGAVKEGRSYVYYAGEALSTSAGALSLSKGLYYSVLTFADASVWYSETFYVPGCSFLTGTAAEFLKLEWYNDTDIRPIFYNDKDGGGIPYFRNVAYLDTFITQSEPEIIEDGEKDGNDEQVPTFTKALIRYRITELVPDYLKKALVLMQMHDHVTLTTRKGTRSGELLRLETATAPEAFGGLSSIDIIFEEDLLIKKGCGDNMS
jgi:hypothetical protein